MIELLPLFTLLAAVSLTYLFCIRPMRRGSGCHMMARPSSQDSELAALRRDLDDLRSQQVPSDAGR